MKEGICLFVFVVVVVVVVLFVCFSIAMKVRVKFIFCLDSFCVFVWEGAFIINHWLSNLLLIACQICRSINAQNRLKLKKLSISIFSDTND